VSIVAICPVASLVAHNATLDAAGFGPNNFSVPCYVGAGAQYAALHCWPDTPFADAVKALAGVVWQEGPLQIGTDPETGDPITTLDPVYRTNALIEAQGAVWGAQSPPLPDTGTVTAGEMYQYGDSLWSIIQTFDRSTFSAPPETYPALCRRVRNPYATEPWRQPIDQYDSYKLVNPFTGSPDRCEHNGSTWEVTQADGAGNNVWEPGVFGWTQV